MTPQLWVLMKRTELKASGRKWLSSLVGRGWTRHSVSGRCTASTCPEHPAPFWRFHTRCEVGGCRARCSRLCEWHLAEPRLARTPELHTRSRWRRWAERPWIYPWEWPSCDSLQEGKREAVSRGTKAKATCGLGCTCQIRIVPACSFLNQFLYIAANLFAIFYVFDLIHSITEHMHAQTWLKKTWWPHISVRD